MADILLGCSMPRVLVLARFLLVLVTVLHWTKAMEGNHLDKIGTPWQQREAGDVQHVCVQGGCVRACVLGGAPEFET